MLPRVPPTSETEPLPSHWRVLPGHVLPPLPGGLQRTLARGRQLRARQKSPRQIVRWQATVAASRHRLPPARLPGPHPVTPLDPDPRAPQQHPS